jgi:hypothetical protein
MAIFVETDMAVALEELWTRTQDPALHQRWDVRFREIAYAAADVEWPAVAPGSLPRHILPIRQERRE